MSAPTIAGWSLEALHEHAELDPVTGCRLNRSNHPDGYNKVGSQTDDRRLYSHRLALALALGLDDLPSSDIITRHLCHEPRCCEPGHLRFGSHAENTADSIARGTHVSVTHRAGVRISEAVAA